MMFQTLSTHPVTLGEVLRQAVTALTPVSPTPQLDAEVLVMHVLGLGRSAIITHAARRLEADEVRRLEAAVARRQGGEPVAYILGYREFWSMRLHVTPATLIPRVETELLVEQALARIPSDADWTLVEVGTGCGAIALALARERPRCRIIATESSRAALAVARTNAREHGLTGIDFRRGSWLEPLDGEKVDMIISNPPYVRADDPHLDRGDLRFEPRQALTGGADGLDAIRTLAGQARTCLRRGGWLLLEHGHDQARAVGRILERLGYRRIECHADLAGLDRVNCARAA